MPEKIGNTSIVRFENFALDLRSGELLREGDQEPIRLPEQPFLILTLLLERQGQVVAREEIRRRLWPDDTVVEFEHSISAAMNRLRQALGDSADDPHYIETLARRGYRWKVPAKWETNGQETGTRSSSSTSDSQVRANLPPRLWWRLPGLLLSALLLIATVTLLFFWRQTRNQKRSEISVVPITAMPGFEWGPTFSPDGNEIAFVHADDWQSSENIYVKALEEEKSIQITKGAGESDCPDWSPDGKLIAYKQFDDSSAAIFLITPLGGSQREFRHLSQSTTCQTSWSPDSKSLAYGDAPGKENSGIFLADIQSASESRITTAPSESTDEDPAFSPGGDQIAFLRSTSSAARDLFIVSLPDHHIRRVTFLNAGLESPQWTSDGKRILFCVNPTVIGERSLFSVLAAGGDPEQLSFISTDAGTPAISPHGDKLAYSAAFFDSNVWKVSLPGGTFNPPRALNRDPKYQQVVASSRLEMQPQLSPDGTRLAYESDRDGSMAIWMSAVDGSNPVRLVRAGGAGSPKWSPDGNFLVFDSVTSGSRQIHVVRANSGEAAQITSGESESAVGSWSADGKWIYFTSNRRGNPQIWKRPFQGESAPVQVTVNGGSYAQESPDGRYIYYEKDDGPSPEIWRVPTGSGREERVVDSETWFWCVAKDGIYFIVNKPTPAIKRFRFDTRRVEMVSKLKAEAWGGPGLSLSPDEKAAYYTQMDSSGADIMLIKNFHTQ